MELHVAETDFEPAAAEQTPEGPGLDGNWIQECTDWNWDQDYQRDNRQGPLQVPAVKKFDKTSMILQL